MEPKKKYLFGYGLLFGALCCLFVGFFSTSCYANDLVPINHIDKQIVSDIFDFWYENNSFSIFGNTINSKFLSFYSNVSQSVIDDFVVDWNSNNWSSADVQYIQQMVIIPWIFEDRIIVDVLFSNNSLGNIANHLELVGSPYASTQYWHYIDDNHVFQAGSSAVFELYADGSIDFYGFRNFSGNEGFHIQNYGFTEDNSSYILSIPNVFIMQSFCPVYHNTMWYLLSTNNLIDWSVYTPDTPSNNNNLGNITNSSGDSGGNINLQPIQDSLTNIQNQISGDTQKITNQISGDTQKVINTITNQPNLNQTEISQEQINNALDFDFMADPYSNFWFEMTNGLSAALTNSVRQLPVDWLGYQGFFDLDQLGFNYPASLRLILTSVSTVSMVWLLVKWWKIIIDKLTSGDMDEVLAMNEEERYH